eukprot:354416-Chlamydomonas_euryale.AAC.1
MGLPAGPERGVRVARTGSKTFPPTRHKTARSLVSPASCHVSPLQWHCAPDLRAQAWRGTVTLPRAPSAQHNMATMPTVMGWVAGQPRLHLLSNLAQRDTQRDTQRGTHANRTLPPVPYKSTWHARHM